ncbi:MAG: hypothetical protein RQ758_00290 [Methanomicrobiaceae archaeon]|nr:hypothetical protein [Methanomicrobiaceae archaeon]
MKGAGFIVVLLACVLAAGCVVPVDQESGPQPTPVESYATVTTTPPPTTAPPVTPTPYVPEEVGVYEAMEVDYDGNSFEIAVQDYSRGLYANELITEASSSNPGPSDNFEYLLIRLRVLCTDGDDPVLIYGDQFSIYSGGKKVALYPEEVVLPSGLDGFARKYMVEGERESGWLAYEVPQNLEVKLAFEPERTPLGFVVF